MLLSTTLLLSMAITAFARKNPAANAASLTVFVINDAQVSPAELTFAERAAEEIIHRTGIQLAWRNCTISPADFTDSKCSFAGQSAALFVRIVSNHLLPDESSDAMGISLGNLSTVHIERVAKFARETNAPFESLVLGLVFAHELGHLLLPPGHSPVGVMKSPWNHHDMQIAHVGTLTFTSEQAQIMRANVEARSMNAVAAVAALGATALEGKN
jgi:hypothetical protein